MKFTAGMCKNFVMKIVATFFSASSQGQRAHSAQASKSPPEVFDIENKIEFQSHHDTFNLLIRASANYYKCNN